ncbi:MAG: cellulase family glycosylhydrolase [Spirochaetales bacterium]|nr:cellulase family glycosylhydrolase [Spirochaetales bacterium]
MKRKRLVWAALVLLCCSAGVLWGQQIGDVNNDNSINIVDALLIAQSYVGLNPSNFNRNVADVNSDGSINIVDALLVAQYYVGTVTEWPPGGATNPPTQTNPPGSGGTVPALHADGNWLKDSNNNNVRLKGVALADLDAIYKGDRNQRVNTTAMSIIDIGCSSGWNVDVFRLTVHPEVSDETGSHGWLHYSADDYFNNILDPAVQHCIQKGKYAIIDWHYVGVSWDDGNVVRNTENFWNYIAPKYADHPNVMFELLNEPGQGSWSGWKSRAQQWVNLIRNNHGADNIILIGGPNWSQVTPGSTGDLLSGGNLAYVCHIYPQHGVPNWIDWVANNAPTFMTEWGYESGAPNPVNGTSSWANQLKSMVNSKPNVNWTAWCFDFVYRSVMFDTNWVLLGNGQTTSSSRFHGGPDDNSTNYMGQFVKSWLAE